jgi:hypothetical protein
MKYTLAGHALAKQHGVVELLSLVYAQNILNFNRPKLNTFSQIIT